MEITLVPDSFDVGFYVYLDRFQRTLDPGSSMASSYSSLVDFVTVKTDPKTGEDRVDQVIEDGVLITLNQPITRKTRPQAGPFASTRKRSADRGSRATRSTTSNSAAGCCLEKTCREASCSSRG